MPIKVNVVAWLTAGLLVAGAGAVAGRAGALQGEGLAGRGDAKATLPGAERPPAPPDVLPLYVVKVDRIKAANLGLTTEDVRKVIADAFESPNPMSHRVVWIDPANKDQCFVRVQTLDGGRLPVERLLDLMVVARMPVTRVCPLRNLVTLARENRSRLEAEVEACEAELTAADAELEQAKARVRRSRASLAAARARLRSRRVASEPPTPEEARRKPLD